jgi:hypothetical protein
VAVVECSKVCRRSSYLRVGRNLWWSDLTLPRSSGIPIHERGFYWRAVFVLRVFEMEYRGKHYTIVQGVEPSIWSLLDDRVATILQIRGVLAIRMFELRQLRRRVQTAQVVARRQRRMRSRPRFR